MKVGGNKIECCIVIMLCAIMMCMTSLSGDQMWIFFDEYG